MQSRKPNAVLLASPGMGHLIPVLELGKRLVSHHGFTVTIFVVTTDASLSPPKLLKQAQTSYDDLLEVVSLPPVDISGQIDETTAILTKIAMMIREALPSLRSAILAMKVRPVALIVDMFGTEAFAIAEELMLLKYVFITSNAWFLALTVHAPTVDKEVEDDHVNNQKPLFIPGCKPICFVDSFEPVLRRNKEYSRMGTEISTADGILVNTFHELEPQTLAALNDNKKLGMVANAPVYPIGPLVRPVEPGVRSEVLSWLDIQPKESVIYVSFGSGGTLSAKQIIELAWGLEKSQQRYVWVVRPPVENDSAATVFKTSDGCIDSPNYLPDGFLNRTSKIGRVVQSWAPQAEILSHPSIGGFLSHCGWNSSLESIVNGVPMIVWPLYAEQKMNATMLADHIGVATRSKLLPSRDVIGRSEIEAIVRKILVNKEGEAIRAKVKMLKSCAAKALSKGGSSYNSLANVAKDCEISLQRQNANAGA
ncbi:hypothetical protein REPUB_Repub10bG0160500 [Reevesia pubescens]